MAETYKIQNNLATPIMETMFERKTIPYSFRNTQEFQKLCDILFLFYQTFLKNIFRKKCTMAYFLEVTSKFEIC